MSTQQPAHLRIATPADLRAVTGAPFTVSDQQWEAISAPPGPGVVIAGAGSGKTELMSARVIYLVANGYVAPHEVLGLTFTTKATAELSHRIRAALAKAGLDRGAVPEDGGPAELLEPTVSTYNAYAAGLLSEHGLRIGHESDIRIMGDAARFQLAQRVIAEHRREVQHLSDHPPTVINWLLALDGAMSEHLVTPAQVRAFQTNERPLFAVELADLELQKRTKTKQTEVRKVLEKMDQRRELLDLVETYREAKARYRLMDFSDQIAGACRIADEFPEVAAQEREKYKVVLLDEYQDTSVAQALLLARLFSGPDAASGRGHAVTAVGDPNQAIYGWRGASVANIANFREQFPQADGTASDRFSLTVNRRSDRRILDVANVLAAPLLEEQAGLVEPLEWKPDAEEGVVRSVVHRTTADELDWLTHEVRAAHDRIRAAARDDARRARVEKRFDDARALDEKAQSSWREIGVLVRTNKEGADAYDALSAAGIPVEIVGLGGLIRLPEVAQVVATLSLLEDVTDNASLLTLLAGPRWEIGVRDLALLGKRSMELAKGQWIDGDVRSLAEQLSDSVAGADPTELASLNEALESPGDLPYSPEAKERFALLASELEHLRSYVGEPLLDLLRRIIDVTGLDIELASSTSPAAAARRENLDLFVKAVAEFQAVDGTVTLPALNAWLAVEDDAGGGLDLAPPSESDSVKLLTVHRSKGLEYDVVFMIGVAEERFPSKNARSQWTTVCHELPSRLRGDAASVPQLEERSAEGLAALKEEAKAHHEMEELRLGYVAFTRARHEFVVSSHVWGSRQKPLKPSPYLRTVREMEQRWGADLSPWYAPAEEEPHPASEEIQRVEWPSRDRSEQRIRREEAARRVRQADPTRADDRAALAEVLSPEGETGTAVVERWDAEIERLLLEERSKRRTTVEVSVPSSLSATALMRLREDPESFALDLLRPMPRPPAPAARFGTRFHAWVEARFGQQGLLEPDDLPGRFDADIDDDADLEALQKAFESGDFADRAPHAVEAPFSLVLDGTVVRGRIDAVYTEPGDPTRFLVVDWKTNRHETADPTQLALYRVAWAELKGVPVDQVSAAFHYVRSGRTVRFDDLPGREELAAMLRPDDAEDLAPSS
ncbi:ATP-dependent DNA helicase [Nocardioides jishulii]|uniref:DNA 3'-5' helicase n=1 Tax=Nocardioides jishulii TaxID=2575440 RepID=A0A4V6X604_9ACTN|nr:ATP-dependent DNA helicase [Nocardioides jishulii]QCX28169.1 ATP-dependent helicase [Nocardioides jishulii]TKI60833.1 ATP-dependent helicase [Nocardioides jishulii]